jgi:esterase/lipase
MKFLYLSFLTLSFGCTSNRTTLKTINDKNHFEVKYREYQPFEEKKLNHTVLILPPTGGVTYLDKSYAKALSKKGATVKLLTHWTGEAEESLDLDLHQRLHTRAMHALSMVLESTPREQKISLMGTSLGAIFTVVAANQFERIDRVLSIAGGNPVHKVITHSNYKTMKNLREKRLNKFKFKNIEDYTQKLEPHFLLEPEKNQALFKNKHRAVVILLEDQAVPTEFQKYLKNYWQPEMIIELNSSHFWGIVKTWLYHSEEIIDFLIGELPPL